MNLLSNAIKFSPDGSLITVGLEPDESIGLRFSVSDEGPGIAEEQQASIFEHFKQGKAKSEKLKGTGLGLAICKAIVQGHGGDIGATSAPGTGTTFWFTVPGVSVPASGGTTGGSSDLEPVAQPVDSLN